MKKLCWNCLKFILLLIIIISSSLAIYIQFRGSAFDPIREIQRLNSDVHPYFGYVALDLISARVGKVTCKICGETYEAGQLKEFAIGHGKVPFAINPEQKGGIRLFKKRRNPSMFGGKGYKCPAGHTLISMETWRT